jgi:hypothetical protein
MLSLPFVVIVYGALTGQATWWASIILFSFSLGSVYLMWTEIGLREWVEDTEREVGGLK